MQKSTLEFFKNIIFVPKSVLEFFKNIFWQIINLKIFKNNFLTKNQLSNFLKIFFFKSWLENYFLKFFWSNNKFWLSNFPSNEKITKRTKESGKLTSYHWSRTTYKQNTHKKKLVNWVSGIYWLNFGYNHVLLTLKADSISKRNQYQFVALFPRHSLSLYCRVDMKNARTYTTRQLLCLSFCNFCCCFLLLLGIWYKYYYF